MNFTCLKTLRRWGFNPEAVLDIGAYRARWTWECKKLFPHARYTLVDPNFYPEQRDYEYHTVALGNTSGEFPFWSNRSTGDSLHKERTHFYDNVEHRRVVVDRMDDVFRNHTYELIKIDAQGSEQEILEGGLDVVGRCEVLVLELPLMGQYNVGAPTFAEQVDFVSCLGFVPFEVCEVIKNNDVMFQIGMCFVREDGPLATNAQEQIEKIGL